MRKFVQGLAAIAVLLVISSLKWIGDTLASHASLVTMVVVAICGIGIVAALFICSVDEA